MRLRVWCPYVSLHPDTDRALWLFMPGTGRWRLRDGLEAYHWWWSSEWGTSRRLGAALALVEQDIVPHEGVLPAFRDCPEPWCVFPYPGPAGVMLTRSLGCVRWSHDLLTDEPDLPDVVGRMDDGDGIGPRDWRRLDARIAVELDRRGYTPHQHTPPVGHRHHYDPQNRPCLCGACPD